MSSFWIEVFRIREFSIVIFFIKSFFGLLGNFDEVLDMQKISEILIKIILEVLDEVHVLLDEVVSSDSWEGEGLIVELPSMN